MNLGDKAVLAGCVLIVAGWVGYHIRDSEAPPPLHCSAYREDGHPLAKSIIQANGRVLCEYEDRMPNYTQRSKKPWT